MKVGTNDAPELKALADERGIPFANLLRGYVLEDLILRIYSSGYREYLWLREDRMLGEEAYRSGGEDRLVFCYQENSRLLPSDRLVPGQTLGPELAGQFAAEVFGPENSQGVFWQAAVQARQGEVLLNLYAFYKGMQVPVNMEIRTLSLENQRPDRRTIAAGAVPKRTLSYLVYSAENQLSSDLFQIMDRLELIGDMGAYYRMYRTLKSQPLSGRHIIEELTGLAVRTPQVKKERRLEQLKEYRGYAYMRRRWEQYAKRHGGLTAGWEEALDLILVLVEPVWKAFCRDEVFFDDWMPELGRLM